MRKALAIIAACAQFAFHIAEKMRPCAWMSKHIEIPPITGALEPGPLDTSRVPPIEGLHDLLHQRHVHFFTFAKSARVGGTLFAITHVLHQIANDPGPILWVDPSRSSARQLFRRELEPFILACPPVARQAMVDKEHWTASLCFFRGGSFLRMAGAGSPNELAGYQARDVVINEGDKIHHTTKGEAPAHDLAIARTKQFRHTRKIIENSTPTDEHGPTWTRFLRGSQRYCYLPCPHCTAKKSKKLGKKLKWSPPEKPEVGRSASSYDPRLAGWQRFTFSPDEKDVPFDIDLEPLPKGETRVEKTGQFRFDHCRIVENREVEPGKFEPTPIGWDYEKIAAETWYECQHCAGRIEHTDLNWMLSRYRWIRHRVNGPRDHESAHYWAAYSPFEHWGDIAKKFILAGHNPGALHDVYNNDFGLPFRLVPTEVQESDITRLQLASPHYLRRTIPHRPELLSMTIDVQDQTGDAPFWWGVWAWGIHWDQPGWPTWCALVDYGSAVSWDELEEIAGIAPVNKRTPDEPDRYHSWNWRDPATGKLESFTIFAGLVDSGDQAQSDANVYDFCRKNGHIFSPSKGGGRSQLFGQTIRTSILEKDTPNALALVWYRSDYFAQKVYRQIIKDRKYPRYLPRDLDADFIDQVTDERTVYENGRLIWKAFKRRNHLGDVWKMNEVLEGTVEEVFDDLRLQRMKADEAAGAGHSPAPGSSKGSQSH
ncbi:MAG: phage terminase large subunit family protein [Chthoniobacter sp.]|nr:phage terminase large subunit family protein [Chthoniobacter sp.]